MVTLQEVGAREPVFASMATSGRRMMAAGHFAKETMGEKLAELETEKAELGTQVAARSVRLKDALESTSYMAEAEEAGMWMREKLPLLTSPDAAQGSEEGTRREVKKLDALEKDVEAFKSTIAGLGAKVATLVDRGHFDAVRIQAKQSSLEKDYAELVKAGASRRKHLLDTGKYLAFLRQTEDLSAWLHEKNEGAESEDYGRDLDDCLSLIASFDLFLRELAGAGERVASINRTAEELQRTNHPFSASIKAKTHDLAALWKEVNEAATERQSALKGALEVHKYDNAADETLNWLQEKEALQVVAEAEDLSQQTLSGLKTLLEREAEFGHGLAAVEKAVVELGKEADRLVAAFPNAADHVEVRRSDMEEQLKDVLGAAAARQEKLNQALHLQTYFQEYRDLMLWLGQMTASVTSEGLPRDVAGCEALAQRHGEYQAEIRGREPAIADFLAKGAGYVRAGHVLSAEIAEKMGELERALGRLKEVWEERRVLYLRNQDAQIWKRDATALESWLVEREAWLGDDWKAVDSVPNLEDLIRHYDDFLVTLHAQGDKFEGLKKLTLLEQAWASQTEKEAERRKAEETKKAEKRKDTIVTLERGKILEERKQERARRKTQEISFFKPDNAAAAGDAQPRRKSDPKVVSLSKVCPSPASSLHRYIRESHLLQSPGEAVEVEPSGKPALPPKPPRAALSLAVSSGGESLEAAPERERTLSADGVTMPAPATPSEPDRFPHTLTTQLHPVPTHRTLVAAGGLLGENISRLVWS